MTTETVRVKLLAGRTNYGHRGTICDYPADEAKTHADRGTVLILGPNDEEPTVRASDRTAGGEDDELDVNLAELSVKKLKAMAKKLEIPGYGSLKKDELIAAIDAAQDDADDDDDTPNPVE